MLNNLDVLPPPSPPPSAFSRCLLSQQFWSSISSILKSMSLKRSVKAAMNAHSFLNYFSAFILLSCLMFIDDTLKKKKASKAIAPVSCQVISEIED